MNNYQKQVYRTQISNTTTIISSTVAIFNISEPTYAGAKTNNNSDTVTSIGSENIGNAQIGGGTSYEMGRLLAIFDTSSITSNPISGTFSIYVTSNPVITPLTFRTITPNVTFLPLQVLTVADWDSWNGSHDNSGTAQDSLVIPATTSGFFTFTLSLPQLIAINSNNEFSVFVVSNGDFTDTPPSTNSRPFFSAQSGLGISGIGDYKLTLNF